MSFVNDATLFRDFGLNPLPLSSAKIPIVEEGQNYLYEEYNNNQKFLQCHMIGVACGLVSGNLTCIDFDCHSGQQISVIFNKFINDPFVKDIINKYYVAIYMTPRGGFHFITKVDKTVRTQCIARWKDGEVMIEIRGHGSYVACAPSEGYERIGSLNIYEVGVMPSEDFNKLMDLCRSYTELESISTGTGSGSWPSSWDETTPDGKFNEECEHEAKQLLIDSGWTYIETRTDGVEYWQRPGKDHKDGHSATFGKQRNMFYVFTQSCPEFAAPKGYTPFDVFTILKHKGDWKAAKDELRKRFDMPDFRAVQITEFKEAKHVTFPIEIFPEMMQDYIISANKAFNFSVDFTSVAMLSAVSIICGNKFKLRVKNGWEEAPIFWFAVVGDRGTTKSHPVNLVLRPLAKMDKESYDQYTREKYAYDAAQNKSDSLMPQYKQLVINDSTLEGIHKVHTHNPRGVGLHKDELVGFINDMNKYRTGSDEQFWLNSFNNKSYIINRSSKEPALIDNVCINIIGTIQPDVLISLTSKHTDNGLLDRFLYTKTETQIYPMTRNEMDADLLLKWDSLMRDWNRNCWYKETSDTINIHIPDHLFDKYIGADVAMIETQTSDEETYGLKSYISKIKTYYPRFILMSILLRSMENMTGFNCTDQDFANADKMTEYFISSARHVFNETARIQEQNEVFANLKGKMRVQKITELNKSGMEVKEIAKKTGVSVQRVYAIIKKK